MLPVPRVAMNESIFANSTTTPLRVPKTAPPRITVRQASGQGQASFAIRCMVMTWAKPSP